MADWTSYEPEGDDYIPVDRWGKDHWSTFAYAETRAVDADGALDNRRMRCDARLHRHFATQYHVETSNRKYPTRLKDGEIEKHDDWSCLEDAAATGLLHLFFQESPRRAQREMMFNNSQARVVLTDSGRKIAAQLRHHKAQGGNWGEFEAALL